MGFRSRMKAWKSYDPLSQAPRDADPRLRGSSSRTDPNAGFLGDASQGQPGNDSGPELALYRLVRWLTNRRRDGGDG